MRITRLQIQGLFGIFTHDIPFNNDEHITIIFGPNGIGKTFLLTIINAIFNSLYIELTRIPFDNIIVFLDDNSQLKISKSIKSERQQIVQIPEQFTEVNFEYTQMGKKLEKYQWSQQRERELRIPLEIIEHQIPGLQRIGPQTWRHIGTREILSLEDIFNRYGSRLPFVPQRVNNEPDWMKIIKQSVRVHFIQTQRLFNLSTDRPFRPQQINELPQMIPSVTSYSQELAGAIQSKFTEYAVLSQSLDRTFPIRYVNINKPTTLTIEQLRTKLGELEDKRTRLMSNGLLEKEREIDFKDLLKIDENNRDVLSVYIEDVEKKLNVFNELADKIDLLVKIINSRFLYKRLLINKNEGFKIETINRQVLPPTSLSSGEQHELVLFFQLLFKVNREYLILIDEPELSLHVAWQQLFLNDVKEIANLIGFNVLLATHSPQIVHDSWDLTVELKGPETK